jgi:hypothetical protein
MSNTPFHAQAMAGAGPGPAEVPAAPSETVKPPRKQRKQLETVAKAPRKKRATPVSEVTAAVSKRENGKKAKTVKEDMSDKPQFGKARKIREKGARRNALDKIPSSNKPPTTEEENKEAHYVATQFANDFLRVLEAVGREMQAHEKQQQQQLSTSVQPERQPAQEGTIENPFVITAHFSNDVAVVNDGSDDYERCWH